MFQKGLKKLSDDELMGKIEKVREKLGISMRIGSGGSETLKKAYEQLIEELDARYDDGYKPKDIDFSKE